MMQALTRLTSLLSMLLIAASVEGQPQIGEFEVSETMRGPDVTLIESEDRTVFEYRQNGQLRMVKVIPKIGKPYYLVPSDPTRGFGDLERAETLIPSWPLIEF